MTTKRKVGHPPLPSTEWLANELAQLPAGRLPGSLYRPWLARYFFARGFYPIDPRRSFRAAVATCRRRMAKNAPQTPQDAGNGG